MRATTLTILLLIPLASFAQAEKLLQRIGKDSTKVGTRIIKADSALTERYLRVSYDTAYITRPTQAFTVRVRMNASGSRTSVKGDWNGHSIDQHLKTPNRITASIGLSYRGLGLSLSINPAKLKGKSHDTELNFSFYNNRYGADVAYQDSKDYSGTISIDGNETDMPADIISSKLLNISAYYAFNHRRFSYPAALTQSYIQRRSAGSWMLAASFNGGLIDAQPSDVLHNPHISLRFGMLGLGGGYGYNLVTRHRWLLHASALPTLVVGSLNRLTIDDDRQKIPYVFPELLLTERVAIVHQFNERHFLGLTFVAFNTLRVSRSDLRMIRSKWRLRVSYGYRF